MPIDIGGADELGGMRKPIARKPMGAIDRLLERDSGDGGYGDMASRDRGQNIQGPPEAKEPIQGSIADIPWRSLPPLPMPPVVSAGGLGTLAKPPILTQKPPVFEQVGQPMDDPNQSRAIARLLQQMNTTPDWERA